MKFSFFYVAVFTAFVLPLNAEVITFDDLSLSENSSFDPGFTTIFSSNGAIFNHGADWGDCCWDGFTYSNRTDTTTAGYLNDMSAYTGDGVGAGQDNYAVAYWNATLHFSEKKYVQSAYFTNTTYALLAMRDGDDGNTVPFIKGPFTDGDFFKVTVNGLGANDEVISSLNIFLAQGTNILETWVLFDLSSLGQVHGLNFTVDSSDKSPFGINTPAYFALDNLQVTSVPVPASAWMFGSGLLYLARKRYSCKRS